MEVLGVPCGEGIISGLFHEPVSGQDTLSKSVEELRSFSSRPDIHRTGPFGSRELQKSEKMSIVLLIVKTQQGTARSVQIR